jgi:hypothetical protein
MNVAYVDSGRLCVPHSTCIAHLTSINTKKMLKVQDATVARIHRTAGGELLGRWVGRTCLFLFWSTFSIKIDNA